MITLTTPPTINSVLGGNTPVGYQKMTLAAIRMQPAVKTIQADISMVSTSVPEMPPITGTLMIDLVAIPPVLTVTVSQLNFYRRLLLTGPQVTAVQNILDSTQATMESGLISLGVVAGVQSPGV